MKEKCLPLGTIVLLKSSIKRIMIIGRLPLRESDQQLFDYTACYYPEGVLDPENLLLFNHADIKKIVSLGYCDDEELAMNIFIKEKAEEWQKERKQND